MTVIILAINFGGATDCSTWRSVIYRNVVLIARWCLDFIRKTTRVGCSYKFHRCDDPFLSTIRVNILLTALRFNSQSAPGNNRANPRAESVTMSPWSDWSLSAVVTQRTENLELVTIS